MSARSIGKPLTQAQFVLIAVALILSGIAALVVLAKVAGPHGKCPGETQTSRTGAASCYSAYQHQASNGVVG